MSTILGPPSATLFTRATERPASSSSVAVPAVATSEKPSAARSFATGTTAALSTSRTEMKALPLAAGIFSPAPICAFMNASPKVAPVPITSPVDFISGPRIGSTPGNLLNGNTASFTLKNLGTISSVKPSSCNVLPVITRAATAAKEVPMHLETNGTVREARGFTSIT